ETEMRRRRDLGRVASDVLAVAAQDVVLLAEDVDAAARDVPVLRPSRHRAQRPLLAATADHDRRVRLLHGLRLAVRLGEPVVRTREVGLLLRQELDEDLDGFVEHVEPRLQRRQVEITSRLAAMFASTAGWR